MRLPPPCLAEGAGVAPPEVAATATAAAAPAAAAAARAATAGLSSELLASHLASLAEVRCEEPSVTLPWEHYLALDGLARVKSHQHDLSARPQNLSPTVGSSEPRPPPAMSGQGWCVGNELELLPPPIYHTAPTHHAAPCQLKEATTLQPPHQLSPHLSTCHVECLPHSHSTSSQPI